MPLLVWSALSYEGLGPVYRVKEWRTSDTYSDILQNIFLLHVLYAPIPGGLFHLQPDGDPIHTARTVQTMFQNLGIRRCRGLQGARFKHNRKRLGPHENKNLAKECGLDVATADEL